MTAIIDHHQHSILVRSLKPTKSINVFDAIMGEWATEETHALQSPLDGYTVRVTFTKYKDHPEWTRVRSTNWRAEHEPNGIFSLN